MSKILVIDDRKDNLISVAALLKLVVPDCNVTTAQSGTEGIRKAEVELPDTILLDIKMPGMDGYEVCKVLKENKKTKRIPVIMITAIKTESKDFVRELETGADVYLAKPIDEYVLAAQVKAALRIKKAEDQLFLHKDILKKAIRYKTRELKDKEALFRVMFEQSPNSLVLFDVETAKILHFNDNACTCLGYTRDEFKNLDISVIEAPEAENKFKDHMEKIIAQGYDAFETKHITKDGNILHIFLKAKIFFLKNKSFIHTVWIDITENVLALKQRRKLEVQLNQARKMESIGVLAGGVAHDFNNILSIIMGNAQLAMMDADDDDLKKNLKDILDAGQRGADLTRQLLTFSRKQVISPRIINLNHSLETTKKMLGRLIGDDIELLISNEPELWPVMMDPSQIDQIIINIAVNARDAMPKGGRIIFETANKNLDSSYFRRLNLSPEPGRYIMLKIIDTGIGMTKEIRQHIFDPFFTTKEKGKGTGLGLSTVYGIIKQNNGFIWVDSKPGMGTCFEIYLPATEKQEIGNGKIEKIEYHKPCETILIAENDSSLLKIAEKILKATGYKILSAHNGEEALKIAEKYSQPIHMLLSDVVMPKLNGNELAEKIKLFYPEIKVVFMSGYTDDIIDNHGVLKPGLKFIEKPFLPEDLKHIVDEVLSTENVNRKRYSEPRKLDNVCKERERNKLNKN